MTWHGLTWHVLETFVFSHTAYQLYTFPSWHFWFSKNISRNICTGWSQTRYLSKRLPDWSFQGQNFTQKHVNWNNGKFATKRRKLLPYLLEIFLVKKAVNVHWTLFWISDLSQAILCNACLLIYQFYLKLSPIDNDIPSALNSHSLAVSICKFWAKKTFDLHQRG